MNRAGYVFFFALTSAGALAAQGCGSSSGGGTGGTGGSTTTSHSSTGTTSSSTTTSSSSGTTSSSTSTSSSSGAITLDCTSYCNEIMTNCTAANAQYPTMDSCKSFCASFPTGALTDMAGDTLGCRIYHGGAPSATAPATHCQHAGPTGGDKDPNGTSGTCGEACEAFCNAAQAVCTGANQQFTDKTACMTACKTFKVDANAYSTADTTTNDMGCRFYHLSVAASSASNATMHCPHIVAASAVCTM